MAKLYVSTIARFISDVEILENVEKFEKNLAKYTFEGSLPFEDGCESSGRHAFTSSPSSESSESPDEEDEKDENGVPALFLQLESVSLVLKLWLRRINLVGQSDDEQFTNLQNLRNAIYVAQKKVIPPFKTFLISNRDKESRKFFLEPMLYVYWENLGEELKNIESEVERVNFEISNEERTRMKRDSVYVCSYLGLKLDFLDRLEKMAPDFRRHRTMCNWIVIFLQNNYKLLTNKTDFLSTEFLEGIGFDPLSSAIETILNRATNCEALHIEPLEWAEMFIKDQFKYHILLSEDTGQFYFQGHSTNNWFELPSQEFQLSDEDRLCRVNIANIVSTKTEMWNLTRFMLRKLKNQDTTSQRNTRLLFHGTDHDSAVDILKGRGLDLLAGSQKRDFSSGKGFYLTDCFKSALNWANCKTEKPALMVFRLIENGDMMSNSRRLTLTAEQREIWQEVVRLFRSGEDFAKRRQYWNNYDLIEGPVATIRRSEINHQLMFEPKPFSYQMCLISEEFAEKFRENLDSILFFNI